MSFSLDPNYVFVQDISIAEGALTPALALRRCGVLRVQVVLERTWWASLSGVLSNACWNVQSGRNLAPLVQTDRREPGDYITHNCLELVYDYTWNQERWCASFTLGGREISRGEGGSMCSLCATGTDWAFSTFTHHVADILNFWEEFKEWPSD